MNPSPNNWAPDYDLEDNDYVAVIGVAGRFPEAATVDDLWQNLVDERDCLHSFTDDELDELGIPREAYSAPNFIRRGTRLPFQSSFDYRFFGFTPKEAEVMDPQSRIFLEEAYSALENAGVDPFTENRPIGVFAGSNPNDYSVLQGSVDQTDPLSAFDRLIGSDKDFLATRLSHRLNLTGPALTLQTACSTSLVAVHMAAQSLLNRECTMALAGGVTVNFRQGVGYFYQDGMILSPTGECRAFDSEAGGTTLGQGCGVVVLKRLPDAIAEGDNILAVVRGSSINNDGSDKAGYTAPSINGQSEAIEIAQEIGDVSADTISYIEAHGTGTKVGDPIEIAGLTKAFEIATDRKQFCAIGSVKSNLGHLDAAAGITGFIKTVLALKNGVIPASIHYNEPNPEIEIEKTPFFVNDSTTAWTTDPGVPRRAGVSAFGIGGTNAHVVLEQAPPLPAEPPTGRSTELLVVSARTADAAVRRVTQLAEAFEANPMLDLGNVAYTLRDRRAALPYRTAIAVTSDRAPADALRSATPIVRQAGADAPLTTFLFSGQGAQYVQMGKDLYESSADYARAFDYCAELFEPLIGRDLRTLVFAHADDAEEATHTLRQTAFTQPALFATEYAATRMLAALGVQADVVIGHSIGEYAAAVHAGVMSVEDAALLVARRGQLMQSMEPGSMLSVSANLTQLPTPPADVELAADNAKDIIAFSGPTPSIEAFKAQLDQRDIRCSILRTSHAFHSAMMDAAATEFESVVRTVALNEPSLPMVSNVTGTWLTPDEAVDPAFWASQIRRPVLFRACIATVAETTNSGAFVEVGPGRPLVALTQQNNAIDPAKTATIQLFRGARQEANDWDFALTAVGALWAAGTTIDWETFVAATNSGSHGRGTMVTLPSYPFERNDVWGPNYRHILAMPRPDAVQAAPPEHRNDLDQWLYADTFTRGRRVRNLDTDTDRTILFLSPAGDIGSELSQKLSKLGPVTIVTPDGEGFSEVSAGHFSTDPLDAQAIESGLADLIGRIRPRQIVHGWMLNQETSQATVSATVEFELARGVLCAELLARLTGSIMGSEPVQLDLLTADGFDLEPTPKVRPGAAALVGSAKVIPIEFTSIATRLLDVASSSVDIDGLVAELSSLSSIDGRTMVEPAVMGLRGGRVWSPWVSIEETPNASESKLRPGGSYLIVGGLGGVGLSIAEHLAHAYNAKLTLTSRSGRPTPDPDNPELTHRLHVLAEIEAAAAAVEIVSANASDHTAMRSAFERAEAVHGHLDGIIVVAGLADQRGSLATRTRQDSIDMMAAKSFGSAIVLDLARSRELDFVLLSSSIASTLFHNRFGQISYVTGNTYAQASAAAARADGVSAITVAWDDWKDMGMSVRAAASFRETYKTDVDLVDQLNSFTPAEGVAVFEQALRSDEPVLHVSPTNLQKRIIDDVHAESPFLAQARLEAEADRSGSEDRPTDVRQAVLEQWTDKIGIIECSDTDDFSALGGDSLQLARVATRLSTQFGISIPLNALTANQEFGAMVAAVSALVSNDSATAITGLPDDSFPLGPAQYRFLDRRWADSNHFNISVLLEREDGFGSSETLRSTLELLGERHPMLCSNLIVVDADIQNIIPSNSIPLEEFAIDAVGAAADGELLSTCEDLQRSLNLFDGPTCKVARFTIADGRTRLLFLMHHMVSDRMSLFTVMNDLDALLSGGSPEELIATEHYPTWINGLTDLATGTSGAALLERWTALPWEDVRPAVPGTTDRESMANSAATHYSIQLDTAQTAEVLADTPDLRIINALGTAVANQNGTAAAVVERLSHGRDSAGVDVSQTVGFFLQYEPFVVFAQKTADEQLTDAKEWSEFAASFDALRFYGEPDVRSAMNDLPQADVLFNYVGRTITAETDATIMVAPEESGRTVSLDGIRAHPLSVIAEITNDQLELRFVYSTKLQSEDEIAALAGQVQAALVGTRVRT